MNRREFFSGLLRSATGIAGCALLRSNELSLQELEKHLFSFSADETFRPEYLQRMKEVLFVYDQVESGFFFSEVLSVIDNLPPDVTVYFLASSEKAEQARERLERLDLRTCEVIASPDPKLWGDWGRDIAQVAWKGGKRVAMVPYNKMALSRGQLTRGYEILKNLKRPRIGVGLAPVSFEGGNLFYDDMDGEKVLFVGNSAILDTIKVYEIWFATQISLRDTLELFRKTFEVDRAVSLGREVGGVIIPQAAFSFHLDMAMTLIAPGRAVVAQFDPSLVDESEIKDEFDAEIRRSTRSLEERQKLEELLEKKGIKYSLPATARDLVTHVDLSTKFEVKALRETAEEMDCIAGKLEKLGYKVERFETDWRHVRKYQSYINVVPSADRLIMPIFPTLENVRARSIPLPQGRTLIEIEADRGDNEYEMKGLNLKAYEFYSRLVGGVRVVQDYFYLACGNVHCILGRLS